MHWPAPHAIDGISCGWAALLSRPTLQKNPCPSGSAVRAARSNAFRARHVAPPSADVVSMMRGLPPEPQERGVPVAGSAHSWNTTKSVPVAPTAADGNPLERGVMFSSDAFTAATLVESTLMFPWSNAANGALSRIDCGLVQLPGPRRFETKMAGLDPKPRQKAETSPVGDATSH